MSLDDLTSATEVVAEATPIVETQAPEPEKASLQDELSSVWDKMNQPREADGKFSPPEKVEAPKSEAVTQPQASPTTVGEAPKPPVSWPKDKTEAWNTLTPDARDFILKRESEFEKGFQSKAEKYKPYDALIDELEQRRPQLAAMGIAEPHQHYRALAAVEEAFAKDPARTIVELAKRYQVERHIAQYYGQAGQQQPDIRVQELEQRIAELSARERQREERQRTELETTLSQEIEAFRSDPKNVHFDTLKQDIAQLLQSGTAASLQDAYEKACYLNPDIRKQMIENEAKVKAEAAAKAAAEAKKKASLNVKSTSAAPGKPTNMRDTMANVWDRVHDAA